KRPSAPRADAASLPRDLSTNFARGGDTLLQFVGTTSGSSPRALAETVAALPGTKEPGLQVYALRVRAGLFGRAFPQQAKSTSTRGETTETTTQLNEWPLTVSEEEEGSAVEVTTRIDLDAVHDGILPDSWVVMDFRAVPSSLKRAWAPENGSWDTPFIVRASDVIAKISRSAYGSTAETTRIELGRPWIT